MIKRINFLGWLLMAAIFVFSDNAHAQTVFKSLQWNNRVLVLDVGDNPSELQEQILMLRDEYDALEERELIVLELTSEVLRKVPDLSPFPFETKILDNRQERRYLLDLFNSDIDVLKVTLIGLDGEIKQSWEGVTEPSEIFNAIDAMPMRQRELNSDLSEESK